MKKMCARCSSPVSGGRCPVCGYDCREDEESTALTAGNVLCERYVIGKVIGSGGFGITYLAYDTELDKTVAIKEYYPKGIAMRAQDNVTVEPFASMQKTDFATGMEKFTAEAELLEKLEADTAVIRVFDTFAQNGTAYYVMEYVHGITMQEYVETYGSISTGQALFAAREAAVSLEVIHRKNIIHRDLSPNNVMIHLDGRIRLVDFGNARPFLADGKNSMTVSVKPGYAPLEQYLRHGDQGPWTDIYSLGAVLFYALTKRTPEDPMARLDNDSWFCEGLSLVDAEFAGILSNMCAVKAGDRYTCAGKLLEDLNRIKTPPERFDLHFLESDWKTEE